MAVEKGEKAVRAVPGGFVLWGGGTKEKPWDDGAFCARTDDAEARVNLAWFRGGWFDALTIAWKDVEEGACYDRPAVTEGEPAPGATLFVPFALAPGASKTIAVQLSWYVGSSHLRFGDDPEDDEPAGDRRYRPWYATRFSGIEEAAEAWRDALRRAAREDRPLLRLLLRPDAPARGRRGGGRQPHDPQVAHRAAPGGRPALGLGGLRRQLGLLPRLLHARLELRPGAAAPVPGAGADAARDGVPATPRTTAGHQTFRAALPIRPAGHDFHAAADGQLGGIMKVYREWRICGDTAWLRRLWPQRQDEPRLLHRDLGPAPHGAARGAAPQHLRHRVLGPGRHVHELLPRRPRAAVLMGQALGDDVAALRGAARRRAGARMETDLCNGEYFIQKVQWKGLRGREPARTRKSMVGDYSPEARALLDEGGPEVPVRQRLPLRRRARRRGWPRCAAWARSSTARRSASHLRAVHRYNLKRDLSAHANPQRPTYAFGDEGGLLLCTWPHGGALSLPFVYSNEVWTGIEYQVASHLMMMGWSRRAWRSSAPAATATTAAIRNPFNEYECGHWYARAMS